MLAVAARAPQIVVPDHEILPYRCTVRARFPVDETGRGAERRDGRGRSPRARSDVKRAEPHAAALQRTRGVAPWPRKYFHSAST